MGGEIVGRWRGFSLGGGGERRVKRGRGKKKEDDSEELAALVRSVVGEIVR